jgi:hypothetical protein
MHMVVAAMVVAAMLSGGSGSTAGHGADYWPLSATAGAAIESGLAGARHVVRTWVGRLLRRVKSQ